MTPSAVASSSLWTVVVGLVATLLALAILVQVLQEMWKFVNSTSARVYTRVLIDFAGPAARLMTERGVLPELTARGPFQLRRLSPTGRLLPLTQDDLVEGLERTAGPWIRRALRSLRAEVDAQRGIGQPASSEWLRFMRELVDTAAGGPGEGDRTGLIRFFGEFGASAAGESNQPFDAERALRLFRERFLSHVVDVERRFSRLQELFQYQYRRRNLTLTFVIGVLVAFGLGFPVQTIYRRATAMSAEQAASLAANVQAIYYRAEQPESQSSETGVPPVGDTARCATCTAGQKDSVPPELQQALKNLVALLHEQTGEKAEAWTWSTILVGLNEFLRPTGTKRPWEARVWYLVGCFLTGVLVSFGAPFWNDLLGAIALKNRPAPTVSSSQEGSAGG